MSDGPADRVFKALADKTRRHMLDLLAEKQRTTGDLVDAFPKLSRFAVMKHLDVLERAGLLVITRDGRTRWNKLNPVPIRDVVRRWISRQEEMWSDVLLNIRDVAQSIEAENHSQPGADENRN
jgi:DNA-binding transcriptional ArsR family regulator